MADIAGKTSNGFTYEGDYQLPSAGRLHWSVTFRHDGNFAGMRHGSLYDMQGIDEAGLEAAVKQDIDLVWTQSR